MSTQKAPWLASSFEELETLVDLETVKKALRKQEDQRVYHKNAYLKRQQILQAYAEAKKNGLVD